MIKIRSAQRHGIVTGNQNLAHLKAILPVILRDYHTPENRDRKILVSIIVKIGQKNTAGIFNPVNPPPGGYLLSTAIGLLEKKPIGQTALLAHVTVVKAVSIHIPYRKAGCAKEGKVTRILQLQPCEPVIHSTQKL